MYTAADLLLHCWIIEAARSAVLSGRGHGDAGVRAATRARLLASRTTAAGKGLVPRLASEHAEWMAGVAGSQEETGLYGWFLLQRLGMYVDAHVKGVLSNDDVETLEQLATPDVDEVNAALDAGGLPEPPKPEWPSTQQTSIWGTRIARIGILGDPHIGLESSNAIIPSAIVDLNSQDVDLSVAIGDITQNGRLDYFEKAKLIFQMHKAPLAMTLGNHDMWGGGTAQAEGRARFESVFATLPYGIHRAGDARLIVLDSAEPEASPFPPFDLMGGSFTDEPKESVPGGTFSQEVLDWMATIEPDGPTFIVLHHPPYPYLGFPPIVFGLDEPSTNALANLALRTKAWGIICGHTHRSQLSDLEGVPVIEVPSSKEWPFGYGVIDVTENGWTFNLKPITNPAYTTKASDAFGYMFRRYARGPDEARAFSWKVP